jgi:hypothetical protein
MSTILTMLMALLLLGLWPSGAASPNSGRERNLGAAMTVLVIVLLVGGLVDTPSQSSPGLRRSPQVEKSASFQRCGDSTFGVGRPINCP